MPLAALRPCSEPGCPEIGRSRFCVGHRRDFDAQRRTDTYDSVWRKLRRVVLATEPLCRACRAADRIEAAHEVDHVIPIGAGGDRLDIANLQPLCASCHRAKSATESRARNTVHA
jgi:5-methylcytosine-specific restriction protein A